MLANRLKTVRESLGYNQKAMSALVGVSYRSWQGYEDGDNVPGGNVLKSLSDLGINVNWLLTGEGPMSRREPPAQSKEAPEALEGYIQVPRYEVAASAGAGTLIHSEQIVDYMTFKAEWLRTALGLSPANAAVISVIGDSMEPYLADGDLILVDMCTDRIENNSVYVIQAGGSLLIKRIQIKLDGTVIVKSDNDRYEPEVFRGESADHLRVVGRLVRRLVR